MAYEEDSKKKCFTFIWKLENASYCWQNLYGCIDSPSFTVDDLFETKWKLKLYPFLENAIGFWLHRQADNKCAESVKIVFELAFLSSDGTVLSAYKVACLFKNGNSFGTNSFALRNEVFSARKLEFLPQDTLTTRCRIWKSFGDLSKNVQCSARNRIAVEKRSFFWNIKNFSSLKSGEKRTYEIKSHDNDRNFMSLELFLTDGVLCDEIIHFRIIPDYQSIKMSTFQLSIVEASKNAVKCFRDEFWSRDSSGSKDFTLFFTMSELLEKKSTFIPNDVLSLLCECAFSFGTMQEEIEKIDSDCIVVAKKKSDTVSTDAKNEFSVAKSSLLDNLKSMFSNSCVSDVKLRTKSQTYLSHKFILSAQSPVFKAMFSNDMKEKISECVDIEDLNDESVSRMLHYIYSAEVEELDWASATELYLAADKYQIINLKDICSSYLKTNLCIDNACEALVLADLHQDENLKGFVQDFIMSHGEDILNSEAWEQLAETNLKLAYETLLLKF
ncbi:unnamed protein product [Larinioides sclopetarius]|uniref:Speckle-type POZ protein n=1 Tax=Larinioides sclopetarius TaxID=280406 RepID=A0AAV1YTC4_9ARAC